MTPEGCELLTLAQPQDDATGALQALAKAVGADAPGNLVARVVPPMPVHAALTADGMGAIIARLMPEDAIGCDDSLTAGPGRSPIPIARSVPDERAAKSDTW